MYFYQKSFVQSRKNAHSNATASHAANAGSSTIQNGVVEKKMKLEIAEGWHSESAPPSVMSPDIGGLFPGLDVEKSSSRPPSRCSISGMKPGISVT